MLGLKYESTAKYDIEVIVGSRDNNNKAPMLNSISLYNNQVYCGLDPQYIDCILEKAVEELQAYRYYWGKYQFCYGACCDIGSNISVFKILTDVVLNIFITDNLSVGEEEIIEILERSLLS